MDVVRDVSAARPGYARVKRAHLGFESKQKWEIARRAGKAWRVRPAAERVRRGRVAGEVVTAGRGVQARQELELQLADALSCVGRLHNRAAEALASPAVSSSRGRWFLAGQAAIAVAAARGAGVSHFRNGFLMRVIGAAHSERTNPA